MPDTTASLVRFLPHQASMVAALGRTAFLAVKQKLKPVRGTPSLPGPLLSDRVPPRDARLVQAFLAHIGSRPGTWTANGAEGLPPTLFPQWTFPLLQRALEALPYPPSELLNGGCKLVVNRPLPLGEAIDVEVQLTDIDDDGRRAIMTESLVVGTATAPRALEIEFYPIVKLRGGAKGGSKDGASREKPRVPADAREIGRWDLGPRAGLEFALLTGDFNPIHWIPPAAKAMGFKSTILHGFASMSRAVEALIQSEASGDGTRLREVAVRFVKPLVLPRTVRAFVGPAGAESGLWIGEEAGQEAYMTGTYRLT